MTARILIDDSRRRPARAWRFERLRGVIRADAPDDVAPALAAMDAARAAGAHLAGFFAYELGYALEPRLAPLMPDARRLPLLWFGVFDAPQALNGAEIDSVLGDGDYTMAPPAPAMDEAAYGGRFDRVKALIAAGDIYQMNLTLKATFDFAGDVRALYRDLRRAQPVSFGALIETDDFRIVSASPELFLDIDGDRIASRPMKGTARRGLTLDEDRAIAAMLAANEKQRAENLMIVDLMRNDLGRLAMTGGVRVSDLFTVETYETLHQMTSGVEAQLKPGAGLADIVRATFPAGSITGAPKIRAMEIIRELEPTPRGVYCGAIGWIEPEGRARFNVAIRTLTIFPDGEGEIGVGSGVVADSKSGEEYAECLLKMQFLNRRPQDFSLFETLRFEPASGYARLDRHLARMAASAAYFLLPFSRDGARRALDDAAQSFDGARRVRLDMSREGAFSVRDAALPETPPVMRFIMSPTRIDSGDVFRRHKTTMRALYDREWADATARGLDEVVYLNTRGEIAEGSRTNIFLEQGGLLLTPPVDAGALPGVLRAELIDKGRAREATLTPADLARADAVWLGNSLRGLVRARMIETDAENLAG